MAKFMLIEQGG